MKYSIHWLVLIISAFVDISGVDKEIPFPKALADASIKVNNLNDILDGALIIGNGDINALIYSDSNSIVLNLTKNDVWDARVETFNDPPIPTLNLIKQLGASDSAFPLKNNNNVFSLDGAYYPHVMYAYEPADPALCKSRNGRQYIHHTWGMTLGVNGFSIQPLWWRYKYDPDLERLKNLVYPVVREVAVFYAEFIEQCEGEKTIHLGPSVSPEHWGWTKNLNRNYNGTFDIALIRYTLKAAIEAAQTLKQDDLLVRRFRKALQRLPDYPLYGEKQPVVVDVEGAPPIEYNIPVPSTPVFPGDVVSWWSSDEEKQLFKRTIEGLKWNGNNATISLNTLIPHKGFNDFGHYTEQFGAGMAISELLSQSVDDIIRIFPALSPGMKACFIDLRAQGGFLVSADGTAEDVEMLQIKSLYGGELRLLSPWQKIEACTKKNQDFLPLKTDQRGVASIQTKAGETWLFKGF